VPQVAVAVAVAFPADGSLMSLCHLGLA